MSPVLIVAGDFVPTGGMDRANFALASYLARSGRSVELVTHRASEDLVNSKIVVHRVAKPCGSYFFGHWLLDRRGRQVGNRITGSGGRVIVNGGNCRFADVNWVHYVHAAYCPTSDASPFRRLKGRLERPFNLRDERSALRSARVVICNSRRTQQDVVERVGVPYERTRVVYYGADAREFFPVDSDARSSLRAKLGLPVNRPVVVFLGALGDRRKGFDVLFQAWLSLCATPDWDSLLVVVGTGAELPAWRQLTTASGLDDRIRYLGFRTDVPEILRAADLLVAPTRYEAYGLGVQEALCAGLPAIVSASAGVAERFPENLRDLHLTELNDTALADHLRRWRSDVDGYRARTAPLGNLLRNHSWDAMGGEILTAMNER